MIREGDRVRVLPREVSPPSKKYAGQTGVVTMTSPSVYGPLLFVQMDGNPDDSRIRLQGGRSRRGVGVGGLFLLGQPQHVATSRSRIVRARVQCPGRTSENVTDP